MDKLNIVDELELDPTAAFEQLVNDARRYRHLRNKDLDTIQLGGVFAGMTPANLVLNGEDLDREVDAEMEAAEG